MMDHPQLIPRRSLLFHIHTDSEKKKKKRTRRMSYQQNHDWISNQNTFFFLISFVFFPYHISLIQTKFGHISTQHSCLGMCKVCFSNWINFLKTTAMKFSPNLTEIWLLGQTRGGGYLANFLHSIIYQNFQHCQNTHKILNITFIFDRCCCSSAETCQIWMWFKESNRYFCNIKGFAYGENGAQVPPTSDAPTHPTASNIIYK